MNLFILGLAILIYGFAAGAFASEGDNILKSKLFNLCFFAAIFIVFPLANFGTYYGHNRDLANLRQMENFEIPNQLSLLVKLKSEVKMTSDIKNLVVDVANQSQSVKNTEVWEILVFKINSFNRDFTEEKFMRENPIMSFLTKGAFPADLGELQFIKLNDLTK